MALVIHAPPAIPCALSCPPLYASHHRTIPRCMPCALFPSPGIAHAASCRALALMMSCLASDPSPAYPPTRPRAAVSLDTLPSTHLAVAKEGSLVQCCSPIRLWSGTTVHVRVVWSPQQQSTSQPHRPPQPDAASPLLTSPPAQYPPHSPQSPNHTCAYLPATLPALDVPTSP